MINEHITAPVCSEEFLCLKQRAFWCIRLCVCALLKVRFYVNVLSMGVNVISVCTRGLCIYISFGAYLSLDLECTPLYAVMHLMHQIQYLMRAVCIP